LPVERLLLLVLFVKPPRAEAVRPTAITNPQMPNQTRQVQFIWKHGKKQRLREEDSPESLHGYPFRPQTFPHGRGITTLPATTQQPWNLFHIHLYYILQRFNDPKHV